MQSLTPPKSKDFLMDEDTAESVVDFILQTPAKSIDIEFQGGEPLTNFSIIQHIIDYSKKANEKIKKKINFIMVTNLTLMDDDILKYCVKNNLRFCTSLDGPKEVHDKNRHYIDGRGSYEDVTHWIKDITVQYGLSLNALPTITKFSLPYWKEIVDEYAKLGFNRIRIRHLLNAGRASECWDQIGYTPDEFLNFWKNALEHCLEINKKGRYFLEGMAVLISRKILSKDQQAYTCFGSPCGTALSQAAYDYEGNVFACDESRSFEIFKLGNVKEDTYKKIFTSPAALSLVALSSHIASMCNACVFHPYCGTCLVSTYGAQKNLISKTPLDAECKIRGGMVEHIFKKLLLHEDDRKILLKWMSTKKGV